VGLNLTNYESDNHWTAQAACRGFDVEMFFTDARTGAAVVKVCDTCPVRGDCLEAAMVEEGHWGVRHGIRGGLTGNQRARLSRTA